MGRRHNKQTGKLEFFCNVCGFVALGGPRGLRKHYQTFPEHDPHPKERISPGNAPKIPPGTGRPKGPKAKKVGHEVLLQYVQAIKNYDPDGKDDGWQFARGIKHLLDEEPEKYKLIMGTIGPILAKKIPNEICDDEVELRMAEIDANKEVALAEKGGGATGNIIIQTQPGQMIPNVTCDPIDRGRLPSGSDARMVEAESWKDDFDGKENDDATGGGEEQGQRDQVAGDSDTGSHGPPGAG